MLWQRYIGISILVIVLLTSAGCISSPKDSQIQARHGMIDLSGVDLNRHGTVSLSGEWEFYPFKLLKSGTIWDNIPAAYVTVPKSWNSYTGIDDLHDGEGYGTFRLTIITQPGDYILSLRIPNISSAYRLWVEGRLIASGGEVADNKQDSSPGQYPKVVSFQNGDGHHEMVVQVSNYDHRRGGIWTDFILGMSDEMEQYQMRVTAEQMVIFGSLVMVGFYHLGLFALRRKEKFTLWFGLLCLFVSLRIIVTGDAYLMQWFPEISWEAALKIEYITFSLSALSTYLYIYYLFPKDVSKRFLIALIIISAALCLIVLTTTGGFYSKLLGIIQLYVVLTSLYLLYILVSARLRRREGALLVLSGVLVFFIAVLNDMSFYNEWFGISDLVPIGLFFFIMMQSFIISSRFSHALRKVELVSAEVRELNTHLEERIEERTNELLRSNETLEKANAELAKMENSRRHLMTNISHDLRTPMTLIQGYLEVLQDEVVKDPKEQARYIRLMLNKVDGLNRLIDDLFDLSKLEAGQAPFDKQNIRLSEWIHLQAEYYQLDIESKGIAFECRFVQEEESEALNPELIKLHIDPFRMSQVMSNLIYNALKHMTEGGKLTITFAYDARNKTVVTGVHDTGSGMDAEDLPYIFDRFYKKDKSRNPVYGGSGIGLAIVKEIVDAHDGTIHVESQLGNGSVFWITLPAREERTA
ncbi:sensor histidine kinase [Paenibacillus abyssi]|uniref:histidine kinase n=1 Tax=Paenibacillus abyssi TaxID=1340531 RepID=A0A917CJE5_9BACL|nr:sensor histidine kinase [Paenibacillus abyssi]GGF89377.1 histidine kinase [Paenibacillus abyssi]